MPLVRCSLPNGKKGWAVKNGNKCHRNKKDAERQLIAIKISQNKRNKTKSEDFDLQSYYREVSLEELSSVLLQSDLTIEEQACVILEAKRTHCNG